MIVLLHLSLSSSNSPGSFEGLRQTLRRNFIQIQQRVKNFPIDPHCKNRLLLATSQGYCRIQLNFCFRFRLKPSNDRNEFERDCARCNKNIAENLFVLGHEITYALATLDALGGLDLHLLGMVATISNYSIHSKAFLFLQAKRVSRSVSKRNYTSRNQILSRHLYCLPICTNEETQMLQIWFISFTKMIDNALLLNWSKLSWVRTTFGRKDPRVSIYCETAMPRLHSTCIQW